MDSFSAIVTDNRTINITSNTHWACQSFGNFRLSKYEGYGNDTIEIIVPEDLKFGDGYAYFTYGDEKCDYPFLRIYSINECFLETTPKYRVCDGIRTVMLYFKYEGEMVDVTIDTNNEWSINSSGGLTYFIDGNKITIVAKSSGGEISVKINSDSVNCDFFIIRLIKKS